MSRLYHVREVYGDERRPLLTTPSIDQALQMMQALQTKHQRIEVM
jgi:hypothetical protein